MTKTRVLHLLTYLFLNLRAPVALKLVYYYSSSSTPDFLAERFRGSIPEPVSMEIFSIIKRSVTSREEAPCRGANYTWGFLGDFERFVCTDSGSLSNVM